MTISPTQAAEFLAAHDRYLILTHVRPDGDTVGCAAALCRALRALGKTAHVLPNSEITPLFSPYLEGLLAPEDLLPDTVVSVDMAARSLFPDNALPYLPRWIWPSTTTRPRSFLPGRPAWTPDGPPAAS